MQVVTNLQNDVGYTERGGETGKRSACRARRPTAGSRRARSSARSSLAIVLAQVVALPLMLAGAGRSSSQACRRRWPRWPTWAARARSRTRRSASSPCSSSSGWWPCRRLLRAGRLHRAAAWIVAAAAIGCTPPRCCWSTTIAIARTTLRPAGERSPWRWAPPARSALYACCCSRRSRSPARWRRSSRERLVPAAAGRAAARDGACGARLATRRRAGAECAAVPHGDARGRVRDAAVAGRAAAALGLMLSYRHGFHAGNHADVLKHVVLVHCSVTSRRRTRRSGWSTPTRAPASTRSTRAAPPSAANSPTASGGCGARRPPAPLADYSPWCAPATRTARCATIPARRSSRCSACATRTGCACSRLHTTESEALAAQLRRPAATRGACRRPGADGFAGLKAVLPPPPRRGLVLIDPSYEDKRRLRARGRHAARSADALRHRLLRGLVSAGHSAASRELCPRARAHAGRALAAREPHVREPVAGRPRPARQRHVRVNPPWTLARTPRSGPCCRCSRASSRWTSTSTCTLRSRQT